jgi:hypothetical protein
LPKYIILCPIDYTAIENGFNITLSATTPGRICIPIQLTDDSVFESLTPEYFFADLSFPGFERVEISPERTQVNITDNEGVVNRHLNILQKT